MAAHAVFKLKSELRLLKIMLAYVKEYRPTRPPLVIRRAYEVIGFIVRLVPKAGVNVSQCFIGAVLSRR